MTALILASGSRTRQLLLKNAGVPFTAIPAAIDERAVEAPLAAGGRSPADIALALAEAKAISVSRQAPGGLVIGADQTLALGTRRFNKPADRAAAAAQIAALAGRTHHLHAGLAAVRDGVVRWRLVESAALTMRPLTAGAIDAYLDEAGDAALASVGAYQVEGPGIRLFEKIDGDFFAILGLPLLPLLAFLREEKVIP